MPSGGRDDLAQSLTKAELCPPPWTQPLRSHVRLVACPRPLFWRCNRAAEPKQFAEIVAEAHDWWKHDTSGRKKAKKGAEKK
jgi:hypothetical protein